MKWFITVALMTTAALAKDPMTANNVLNACFSVATTFSHEWRRDCFQRILTTEKVQTDAILAVKPICDSLHKLYPEGRSALNAGKEELFPPDLTCDMELLKYIKVNGAQAEASSEYLAGMILNVCFEKVHDCSKIVHQVAERFPRFLDTLREKTTCKKGSINDPRSSYHDPRKVSNGHDRDLDYVYFCGDSEVYFLTDKNGDTYSSIKNATENQIKDQFLFYSSDVRKTLEAVIGIAPKPRDEDIAAAKKAAKETKRTQGIDQAIKKEKANTTQ